MPSRATERINFGKIKEIIAPPNLIELQTNSYLEFLQADDRRQPSARTSGLQAVFTRGVSHRELRRAMRAGFHLLRNRRAQARLAGMPARRPDLRRAALRHASCSRKRRASRKKKCSWANCPLMTAAGHVRHQRRRARHRQPVAPFARHLPSRPPSIRTARCSTPSASFPTAVPGTKRSSTPAICSTSISTAKSAAANF